MASKYPETEAFVKKYGKDVEKEIKTRLLNAGKYASGKLAKSIRSDVKEEKEGFIVSFTMADYGKFVDKGVSGYEKKRGTPYSFKPKDGKGTGGKSEFIKQLQKWCKLKGLPKGAAFPIRRSIWKYGIEPTQFFTIPTTRRQAQLEAGIEKAMVKDLDNNIQKELNKK